MWSSRDDASLDDDGLFTPKVGDWAEEKYRLLEMYAGLFTRSMRSRWGCLAYVDLFSGAGYARLRESGRLVPASPLRALGLDTPFDRYVFCDTSRRRLDALGERVSRLFPGSDAHFLRGDVNVRVDEVLARIPAPSPGRTVLTLCFADPYSLNNLAFSTISRLASMFVDFLVLIPTGYDATRNEGRYLSSKSDTVERFLGRPNWREDWLTAKASRTSFDRFMTDALGGSIKDLGYHYEGIDQTRLIRLGGKRVRLYRLVLFSRNKLGARFWRETQKYATPQRSFPFME